MAMVNVNREVTDQFYRYKMPKIIAKVEGKGNGIKTVIVNMHEVAKALDRPATYPTKYFGCELGAQTQFDAKNERYIVNGSHDPSKLQDLLDGFIKRFVLCPECDNPETKLNISAKKGTIGQHCIACGHSNMVDMRHKVTTFIIKNPPTEESSGTAATTPGKKGKRQKGGSVHTNGDASPEVGNGDSKDLTPMRSKSKEAAADDDDDDVDWGEDVSEAAVQARRMQELSGAVSSMVVTEDLEKTPSERIDIFHAYLKRRKSENKVTGVENEKEIVGEAERLDIKEKAPLVLAELLLDTSILTQIKTYRTLFLRFTHENSKAQKYLLGGFELLVGDVYKNDLLPKSLHILKLFYDNDILEEETLIEWGDKGPSKKYVKKDVSKQIHEKVATFINWLKEADEESSDEDEEDVEVVYSHTGKVGTEVVSKPGESGGDAKGNDKDEEEEDDFDIDAI